MGDSITIGRSDGSTFPGYLAEPMDPGPGVLVCHAYWGLTRHVRQLCNRIATEGFTALAPSLYGDKSSDIPSEAETLEHGLKDEDAERDLEASLDVLLALPGRTGTAVATLGFSMGAWGAARLAALRAEVGGVVAFYGFSERSDYEAMTAAVQLHLAGKDNWGLHHIGAFELRLRAAGRELESFFYPAASHGFFNPDHPEDFDAAVAGLAWSRTADFLHRHLDP